MAIVPVLVGNSKEEHAPKVVVAAVGEACAHGGTSNNSSRRSIRSWWY